VNLARQGRAKGEIAEILEVIDHIIKVNGENSDLPRSEPAEIAKPIREDSCDVCSSEFLICSDGHLAAGIS
jgi:Asp-tRNA(Asn)/Glu-tRNA(Gln) amidotransferase C subunit